MKSKTAPEQDHNGPNEAGSFSQDQVVQDLSVWTESDEEMRRKDADNEETREAQIEEARILLDAVFKGEALESKGEKLALTMGSASASEGQKAYEDRFAYNEKGTIIVSDGVGSSGDGAEAAQKSVEFLAPQLTQLDNVDNRVLGEKIMAEILAGANHYMHEQQQVSKNTMSATASVVKLIQENGKTYAVIGNVGDSPIYLLRDGELRELTDYHRNLPNKEQRQALGKPIEFKPIVITQRIKPGDQLIVTSNGVRKNSPELKPIQKLLNKAGGPQQAAQSLATELRGESQDARTVVVLKAA